MYEAGGNIFWIHPFCDGDDERVCAGEGHSWELVDLMVEVFRLQKKRGSKGAPTPVQGSLAKELRLKFTVTFPVHGASAAVFGKADAFPGTMKLVTGHIALWG